MSYATPAEVKQASDITGTQWDVLIERLIVAASETIDRYCNRPDGFLAQATGTQRQFAGTGICSLRVGECAEVQSVEVYRSGGWQVLSEWVAFAGDAQRPLYVPPYSGILARSPFEAGFGPTVRVVARWGYGDAVPDAVREATVILASRWLKRGQSSWADTLTTDMGGTLEFRRQIDPDVQMILDKGRLRRPTI